MIITIILKPNSGSIRGKTRVISQGSSHKSGQIQVDPSQRKNKNNNYYSFEI
jgi:hypothetical protein